jgi:hypothetical protein
MVDRCHVTGATSSPTIFATAITGSDRCDAQSRRLSATSERADSELFFALALEVAGHGDVIVRAGSRISTGFADRLAGRPAHTSFAPRPGPPAVVPGFGSIVEGDNNGDRHARRAGSGARLGSVIDDD